MPMRLDEVREWSKMRKMGKKFRANVLRHFDYLYSKVSIYDETELLKDLPHAPPKHHEPWVDAEDSLDVGSHLGKLRDDSEFVSEMMLRIKPFKLAPGTKSFKSMITLRRFTFSIREATVHGIE